MLFFIACGDSSSSSDNNEKKSEKKLDNTNKAFDIPKLPGTNSPLENINHLK
jgi:hypothetical protein